MRRVLVKVDRIPEKDMVQVFAPDGSDQSFHERVRHRGVGHGFDFFNFQDVRRDLISV